MTSAIAFGVGLSLGIVVVVAVLLAGRRPPRPIAVTCAVCTAAGRTGPRQQLYIEVWDGYGNMYGHYPAGAGERADSRAAADPTLWADVVRDVERVNALQRAAGLGA